MEGNMLKHKLAAVYKQKARLGNHATGVQAVEAAAQSVLAKDAAVMPWNDEAFGPNGEPELWTKPMITFVVSKCKGRPKCFSIDTDKNNTVC